MPDGRIDPFAAISAVSGVLLVLLTIVLVALANSANRASTSPQPTGHPSEGVVTPTPSPTLDCYQTQIHTGPVTKDVRITLKTGCSAVIDAYSIQGISGGNSVFDVIDGPTDKTLALTGAGVVFVTYADAQRAFCEQITADRERGLPITTLVGRPSWGSAPCPAP